VTAAPLGELQGAAVTDLVLHEQLFLVAHGESAGPAARPQSLGPGLVAALLVELLLAGRLDTAPGRGRIQEPDQQDPDRQGIDRQGLDSDDPGAGSAAHAALSEVTAAVLREISGGDPRPPGYWMRSLADGVYAAVSARMAKAGLVRVESRRRTRVEVGDPLALARLQTDLLHLVNGRRELDATACALCGLVAVLRLENTLEAYADPEFGAALREVAKINVPRAEIVLDALEVALRGAPAAIHRQALLWPR
jgi:hypothetical protein